MKTPDIPRMEGVNKMTPLEMNSVRFEKKHTVLTPEVLESIKADSSKSAHK